MIKVAEQIVDRIFCLDKLRKPINQYLQIDLYSATLIAFPRAVLVEAEWSLNPMPKYAGTHYIEEYDGSPRWRYEPVEWAEKMASSKQRRDSFWVALEKLEEDFEIRDEKFRKIHEMCATIDLDCSLRIGLVPTERFQVAVNQLQQRAGYHSPRRTWKNVESSLE